MTSGMMTSGMMTSLELRRESGLTPLADGLPEPWAAEWGEDRYGVFQGFAVDGVVQRMRWVPPGTFTMGSPETEAGRWKDEGPQHEVVLSRGYWLADTPCTQALWQAVMGSNPSRFVSPERPVENVSWDDCQVFLAKLAGRVHGLGARLPTEAEWERACRAGTTQATWLGDLEILGKNNAPLLDPIAWYGGNCGVDFDLDNGHDITGELWKEKQYQQTKGGTHPVRFKQPNPWGLFDMLGNVLEWCSDWFGKYGSEQAIDPTGPATGSYRGYRGGSWSSYARVVRAAGRDAGTPGYRFLDLGFRLARGQETSLRAGAEPLPSLHPGAEPLAAGERSRRP